MAKKQISLATADQTQLPRPAETDAPEKQQPVQIVAAPRRDRPAVSVRKPLFGS